MDHASSAVLASVGSSRSVTDLIALLGEAVVGVVEVLVIAQEVVPRPAGCCR